MQPFDIPAAAVNGPCVEYRAPASNARVRTLPEETPVALVYDGSTEAVMMATPDDLEDFALGFSLTEGLIENPSEVKELTVLHSESGIELRMWLAGARATAYRSRRRRLTGPTGCGRCGIESLAEAIKPTRVGGARARRAGAAAGAGGGRGRGGPRAAAAGGAAGGRPAGRARGPRGPGGR